MSDELFLSGIKKITEQNLTLGELVATAESLKKAGQHHFTTQLYHLWIQFNPNSPLLYVIHFNYAAALSDAGDQSGAKASLERCIALNPDFYPAYINYGSVLEKTGAAGEAVMQWLGLANKLSAVTESAISSKALALKQVGRILEINQLLPNAEVVLKQSLEVNQHQADVIQHFIALRLVQCEWPVVSPWGEVDKKTLMRGIGPLSMAIYTDDPLLQLSAAWNYNKNFVKYPEADYRDRFSPAQATRSGRRRIGYVSSDLRNHAVGFIMAEVFGLHDRANFEVFAYYCGISHTDQLQSRIKDSVEHWVDISQMDDHAAAQRIIDDGIDILVDVNGYTKDARTKLFSLKPAPIIVNWLGYPGSMGSPCHHYIIADDYIIPETHEMYYSEKVMRLPCYQPNDRKRAISPTMPTRADVGLPEEATVFCCFNGSQKISRFTFERWMAIMQRVPNSVLWLLDSGESTNVRLKEAAAARGIAAERIIIAGKMANRDHLARYPLADLFLDTSPYGAHVTASDALWMGVPILTLPGRSFASRVCGSLLTAAGLPEMICSSSDEFIERGAALGNDRAEINRLKQKLAAQRDRCTLFATDALVAHLEKLYGDMWEEFREGKLPRPNLTNLDLYLDIGCGLDHEGAEMLRVKDYQALYREKLAALHRYHPIPHDSRLWTAASSAEADGGIRLVASSDAVQEPRTSFLRRKKR